MKSVIVVVIVVVAMILYEIYQHRKQLEMAAIEDGKRLKTAAEILGAKGKVDAAVEIGDVASALERDKQKYWP